MSHPAALITDVDGTISPIVGDPATAVVTPGALRSLERLSGILDHLIVLSGRSISQLKHMLPLAGLSFVGNHGLEWMEGGRVVVHPSARQFVSHIADAEACLREERLGEGVFLENKHISLSIHYRRAPDPLVARKRLLDVLAECPGVRGLRLAEGRMVAELLPPVLVDKGEAVRRLICSARLSNVVYLGDDITDMDAFRELRALRSSGICNSLAIAVKSDEAPENLGEMADCLVEGVEGATLLLDLLANALEERGTPAL